MQKTLSANTTQDSSGKYISTKQINDMNKKIK